MESPLDKAPCEQHFSSIIDTGLLKTLPYSSKQDELVQSTQFSLHGANDLSEQVRQKLCQV